MKHYWILLIFMMMIFPLYSEETTQKREKGLNQAPAPFVPAIYFVKAKTLPQGKSALRAYYLKPFITDYFNPLQQKMTELPDDQKINFNTFMLFGSYGLSDRVTLGMNMKFLYQKIDKAGQIKKGIGLGDLEVLFKFGIIKTRPFFLSFALNSSFPSGQLIKTPDSIPLSSNSIDFSFRLLSDLKLGPTLLSSAFFYTRNGRDLDSGIDQGDSIRIIITEAIPLPLNFSVEASANYQHSWPDKEDGQALSGTSKDFLSFALGLQYSLKRKVSFQLLYEMAPYVLENFARRHSLKSGVAFHF